MLRLRFLFRAALFAACGLNLHAADRVADYDEALTRAKASGKDIVVFQRGSDWNRLAEALHAHVWMKPEFASALGDGFVLVAVDRPESVGGPMAATLRQLVQSTTPLPPNEITAIESTDGTVFAPRPDGALLASGSNPAHDTLTLKLTAKKAGTVLRIDFPTDASLPGNSAGRAENGNFAIQELEIVAGKDVLKPRAAWASKHHGDNGAWQLIDGIADKHENHWNSESNEHQPRTLFVVLPNPASELSLRLICRTKWNHHVPGCIRAAVLADPALEHGILTVTAAEQLKARNGKFTWRGDDVPRIALLDREGRAVTSEDKPRLGLTPATLAARIRELQKVRMQRDALWSAAEKAQGPARAELLRQSLDLLKLGNSTGHEMAYAFVHEQIKAADPEDKSGVQRWLQFSADPRGVPKLVSDALKFVGEKKHEEALAALDRALADPRNWILDHDRVQRIMLGRFQVYRQWPGNEEKRFDELAKIAALDPTTYHGIGAVGYRNMHFRTPTPEFVFYGWGARQVKGGTNTWDLKVCDADYLDHAGSYTLRIRHGGGKDTMKIRRIALVDNGRTTFEATPNADLAPKGKLEIPLVVKTWNPARKPIIRLELEATDGGTDCAGRFEFEPLLEATRR